MADIQSTQCAGQIALTVRWWKLQKYRLLNAKWRTNFYRLLKFTFYHTPCPQMHHFCHKHEYKLTLLYIWTKNWIIFTIFDYFCAQNRWSRCTVLRAKSHGWGLCWWTWTRLNTRNGLPACYSLNPGWHRRVRHVLKIQQKYMLMTSFCVIICCLKLSHIKQDILEIHRVYLELQDRRNFVLFW